ncbi:MAG: low temperature requirement protein A [Coriobacteriales bacterium]
MIRKRIFKAVEGVSNIELFYDLIFVYCISIITSLCHHLQGDFLDWGTWGIYMFSFLVVLQVWFFTTFLMNRYGDRSASDNICLFINMFLLYFLASGIRTDWENTFFTFNIAWALILVNLLVHWAIKRVRYTNLDEDDKSIMNMTIVVLAMQLVIVTTAAFLPTAPSEIASWVGLAFGMGVFARNKAYRRKDSRFGHLAERCSLLVIIAFGETIVAIATYMTGASTIAYSILVFALVVGLFLIYIYEHDNMLDHHRKSDGRAFLTVTGWLILVIGNLTVGLEFMPDPEVAFLPKSLFLMAWLVLYLLTSFVLGFWNKPEFHYTKAFLAGRLGTCAFIVIVAFATNFNPMVNLICDTAAVYFALWHEWLIYHSRTKLMAFGRSIGFDDEEMIEAGHSVRTREGRKAMADVYREVRDVVGREGMAQGLRDGGESLSDACKESIREKVISRVEGVDTGESAERE